MERLPDWEARLSLWLDGVTDMPFAWGVHDCSSFAAACVFAQTGLDFYEPFRRTYRTAGGAMRSLARRGHDSVAGPFDEALGERFTPLQLQRGDIVSDGESIGLAWWQGGPVALFVGGEDRDKRLFEIGLVTRPLTAMRYGWRLC